MTVEPVGFHVQDTAIPEGLGRSEPMYPMPRYVLLHDHSRIGPAIVSSNVGLQPFAIYGFSSKATYDAFCVENPVALTPFPLVKTYMLGQIAERGDTRLLIVLDAKSPNEDSLTAATMKSVLDAMDNQLDEVQAEFGLKMERNSHAYRCDLLNC